MGREIRKVPFTYEHPFDGRGHKHPQFDECYEDALADWEKELFNFNQNPPEGSEGHTFEEWHGADPDPAYYRPKWTDEERNAWRVYETVSEGTPVSPAFKDKAELVDYLVANGDEYDQHRRGDPGRLNKQGNEPWSREHAEHFVKAGWQPSFIVNIPSA